jgi:two-component system nitrogen regulation sensor histidine kinase NtrY
MNAIEPILMTAASAAAEQAASVGDSLVLKVPETGGTESAVVVFDNGRLVAHAGQTRVTLTPGAAGLVLVHTPFYTAMVARADGNNPRFQAVTVALLTSAPPADRFTQSLVQELVGARDANDVEILPPSDVTPVDPAERRVNWGVAPFARIIAQPQLFGVVNELEKQRARVETAVPMALAAIFLLMTGWRRPARTRERLLVVAALYCVIAIVPLGDYSNVSGLFDASNYYVAIGGRLTANVAALTLTAALALSALFLVLRSPKLSYSRLTAVGLVLAMAAIGPFAMRNLARGITPPPLGASTKLWVAWQLAIALAGASVLLLGASAGQVAMGSRRGLPSWLSPLVASTAAVLAIPLWQAPGAWPSWYPALWILAIALLAFVRRSVALVIGVAVVAGSGAVTLTWASTVRTRMRLAEVDLARLSSSDENAERFLVEFARGLHDDSVPLRQPDELLRRYAASDLAIAGYSARIARWSADRPNVPTVDVPLIAIDDSANLQSRMAAVARQSGTVEFSRVQNGPSTLLIAAVPWRDGGVTTVAVPPRTNLASTDPFAVLTGLSGGAGEPPYSLTLDAPTDRTDLTVGTQGQDDHVAWRRRGDTMHGDGYAGGKYPAHVDVNLRRADAVVPRGALLVLLDAAIVVLLWATSAMADGGLWRWLRRRTVTWSRSYRVRLSVALLAFFVVPAAAFAGWAAYRTREDDRAARELALREALRVAAVAPTRGALAQASVDVSAPLYLYRDGQLVVASDTLLELLAPIGRLVPRNLPDMTDNGPDDEDFAAITVPAGQQSALVGYRRVRLDQVRTLDSTRTLPRNAIVATPARGDEFALDERRADLVVQVLFAMALGAIAAVWLSGVAARSLARPVGTLSEAALALASGRRSPALNAAPVTEFTPVFTAFAQMADDLSVSRSALEAAQRRTEAVLQHVASGVLAVRDDATIILANPRAEAMLGVSLRDGSTLDTVGGARRLATLLARVDAFLRATTEDDAFDVTIGGRQLSARLTRLPNGAVLTLDDVTELASAQRVLAWGEMARQVAHEIKNPLTPIRLGVQHLRRAYRDKRGDFSEILEGNVGRVLEEIDHLDEIARSFSRYGTAPAEREAPVVVSLGAVVRGVLALETLGESGVAWTLKVSVDDDADRAWARVDELREVLLNLLENARLAGAKAVEVRFDRSTDAVCIEVEDDGAGIPVDVLPRIFEPHFSTRTSGSGLGLAISRRLIESWGGTVNVESEVGRGTTVRISLRAAHHA